MQCPHGVEIGITKNMPLWSGGINKCECCEDLIYYVDSGWIDFNGSIHSRSWQPKNRCGPCGGQYIET